MTTVLAPVSTMPSRAVGLGASQALAAAMKLSAAVAAAQHSHSPPALAGLTVEAAAMRTARRRASPSL